MSGERSREGVSLLRHASAYRRDVGFGEAGFAAVVRVQRTEEVTAEELERAEQIFQEIDPNDSLGVYLAEMRKDFPRLLTTEDEIRLAKIVEKGRWAEGRLVKGRNLSKENREYLEQETIGGGRARKALIGCNWRLVVAIALRYGGADLPLLDRIQEGTIGLMKATDRFDYRRGYKFSTYATWWIRQAISRALAGQERLIRLPVHLNDRVRKVHKTSSRLAQDYGREPTVEEIADRLKLPVEKVKWMLEISQHPLSLDKPTGEDEDNNLGNNIGDSNLPSPADKTDQNLLGEKLEEILISLPPREARILRLRFGLLDGRSYTLQEIGEKFGLSRERIRQIEHEALDRLRHPSRARQLKDYMPGT